MPTVVKENQRKLSGLRLVMERLRELHIPFSEVGKNHLRAFGLVKITVRYSRLKWYEKYPQFKFFATPEEKRAGRIDAHLVILVCDREDSVSFYVFEPDDPVFYNKQGRVKPALNYVVDAKPYDGTNSLNSYKMAANVNRFDRIETTLQRLLAEQKAERETARSAPVIRFAPPARPITPA